MSGHEVEDRPLELPFEPLTALVGVSQRARLLGVFCVLAVLGGLGMARIAGRRTYEAESMLIYTPPINDEISGVQVPRLESRKHMVKVSQNLEEVRRRLSIPESTFAIGRECDVKVQKDTQLLSIRVTWHDPEIAARIANGLRDVFLETQRGLLRDGLQGQVDELTRHAERARRALDAALERQKDFRDRSKLTDVDGESKFLHDELAGFELMLEQARVEGARASKQSQDMPGLLVGMQKAVAVEQKGLEQAESLRDVNVRAERLRDAIRDDRERRTYGVQLKNLQVEKERYERSKKANLVSDADYHKVMSEYERVRAIAVDSPETVKWKGQLQELDRTLIPSAPQSTPSMTMLNELRMKALNLQLESATGVQKVGMLEQTVQRIRDRLAQIPAMYKEMTALSGEVRRSELALDALQAPLNLARQARDSQLNHFQVVADASPPKVPLTSRRAIVFLITTLVLGCALCGPVILRELFWPRVRSARELAQLVKSPVQTLTAVPAERAPDLDAVQARLSRVYDLVRSWTGGEGGARSVYVAALGDGADVSGLVDEISGQLAMQGARVGVLHLEREADAAPALGYLQRKHDALEEALPCAGADGIVRLTLGALVHAPHLFADGRMESLLAELHRRCDVLVVSGTAGPLAPDHARFARRCSRVVLVARADVTRRRDVTEALAALGGEATPVEGLIEGVTGRFLLLA